MKLKPFLIQEFFMKLKPWLALFALLSCHAFAQIQVDVTLEPRARYFYEETSCSNYSQYADIDSNNDECFIGGTLYVSEALSVPYMGNYFTNKNNFDVAFFENTKLGPGFTYEFKPRQNGVVYAVPKTGMFKYTGIDTAYTINGSKYNAQIIPANSGKTLIAETVDDSYFSIHKVAKNTNKDLPVMSLTYTTRVFAAIKDKKGVINFTSPSVYKTHTFFKAAWCGDGVVDTQFGEKYDDGPNNGKPGYASTDCTKKVEPETPPVNGI